MLDGRTTCRTAGQQDVHAELQDSSGGDVQWACSCSSIREKGYRDFLFPLAKALKQQGLGGTWVIDRQHATWTMHGPPNKRATP
jgi:hypothetical protein